MLLIGGSNGINYVDSRRLYVLSYTAVGKSLVALG